MSAQARPDARLWLVLMFKALIIQRLFNLSDEPLEFQITDRLSFTRFLGLHIGETIPDYRSFWGFREALAEKGLRKCLAKWTT